MPWRRKAVGAGHSMARVEETPSSVLLVSPSSPPSSYRIRIIIIRIRRGKKTSGLKEKDKRTKRKKARGTSSFPGRSNWSPAPHGPPPNRRTTRSPRPPRWKQRDRSQTPRTQDSHPIPHEKNIPWLTTPIAISPPSPQVDLSEIGFAQPTPGNEGVSALVVNPTFPPSQFSRRPNQVPRDNNLPLVLAPPRHGL